MDSSVLQMFEYGAVVGIVLTSLFILAFAVFVVVVQIFFPGGNDWPWR